MSVSAKIGRVFGRVLVGSVFLLALLGARQVWPSFDMPAWWLFASLWVSEGWWSPPSLNEESQTNGS